MQELPAEHHFARLKQHFRGQGSIKDAVQAMRLEAGKQARDLERIRDASVLDARTTAESREALTDRDLERLAKQGLSAALQLQAWLTSDKTPEELYDHLRVWYPGRGACAVLEVTRNTENHENPNPEPLNPQS